MEEGEVWPIESRTSRMPVHMTKICKVCKCQYDPLPEFDVLARNMCLDCRQAEALAEAEGDSAHLSWEIHAPKLIEAMR